MNKTLRWYRDNREGYKEAHKQAQYDLYPILADRSNKLWKLMYVVESQDFMLFTAIDNEREIRMFRLSDGEPMDCDPVDFVGIVPYKEALDVRIEHPATGEVLMEEGDE